MIKISDAELTVMNVIWDRKEATSIEIIEDLKDYKWNANTIRTLITRLEKKGAIEIVKKTGKLYTYKSAVNESKYKNQLSLEFVKKFYKNSIKDFVIDCCNINQVESDEIRSVLEEMKK